MASRLHRYDQIRQLWHWGRHRAIRRYLRILPRRLFEDYGHRGPYTPAQVNASILRYKVSSPRYSDYAIALFCDRDRLHRVNNDDLRQENYESLRGDLADSYFGGDPDFTYRDATRLYSEHGSGGHTAHHGGEVGGHHGGDGGGHH